MTDIPNLLKASAVRRYVNPIQLSPDALNVLNRTVGTFLREAVGETEEQGRRRVDGVTMRRVVLK